MRSRKAANEQVAEVARRRLELLAAELASASRPAPAKVEAGDTAEAAAATDPPVEPSDLPPGRHARRSVGAGGLVLGWLHDRLPPALQGRVQLGASHLTVVALLVAGALAVTAWWVIRADGRGTIVPAAGVAGPASSVPVPGLSATVGAGAGTAASAGGGEPADGDEPPGADGQVVVDVAGKVRRPGIATLPVGSRVVDALEAAGGARRGVDTTALNLARVLVDGEQIVVGLPRPPGVAAPAASAPGTAPSSGPLVNLNSATQAQLETLPGVGPVTAAAILTWRTDNGAFSSVDELLEVSGIGEATLAEIAPFVTL